MLETVDGDLELRIHRSILTAEKRILIDEKKYPLPSSLPIHIIQKPLQIGKRNIGLIKSLSHCPRKAGEILLKRRPAAHIGNNDSLRLPQSLPDQLTFPHTPPAIDQNILRPVTLKPLPKDRQLPLPSDKFHIYASYLNSFNLN